MWIDKNPSIVFGNTQGNNASLEAILNYARKEGIDNLVSLGRLQEGNCLIDGPKEHVEAYDLIDDWLSESPDRTWVGVMMEYDNAYNVPESRFNDSYGGNEFFTEGNLRFAHYNYTLRNAFFDDDKLWAPFRERGEEDHGYDSLTDQDLHEYHGPLDGELDAVTLDKFMNEGTFEDDIPSDLDRRGQVLPILNFYAHSHFMGSDMNLAPNDLDFEEGGKQGPYNMEDYPDGEKPIELIPGMTYWISTGPNSEDASGYANFAIYKPKEELVILKSLLIDSN